MSRLGRPNPLMDQPDPEVGGTGGGGATWSPLLPRWDDPDGPATPHNRTDPQTRARFLTPPPGYRPNVPPTTVSQTGPNTGTPATTLPQPQPQASGSPRVFDDWVTSPLSFASAAGQPAAGAAPLPSPPTIAPLFWIAGLVAVWWFVNRKRR